MHEFEDKMERSTLNKENEMHKRVERAQQRNIDVQQRLVEFEDQKKKELLGRIQVFANKEQKRKEALESHAKEMDFRMQTLRKANQDKRDIYEYQKSN